MLALEPAPAVVYWGKCLNQCSPDDMAAIMPGIAWSAVNERIPFTLIPEFGRGNMDCSGIEGHRQSLDWAPVFQTQSWQQKDNRLTVSCVDAIAKLHLLFEICLYNQDVLCIQATLTNQGETLYQLDKLALTLPLPDDVSEQISLHGCWGKEYQIERLMLSQGGYIHENRRGRTSHQHYPALLLGRAGFNEFSGSIWAVHLAWSGNHRLRTGIAETGHRFVQAEELLLPGEIALQPGQTYQTPCLYGSYSDTGLATLRQQFQQTVREYLVPEGSRKPRPVHFNTWEGVSFQHQMSELKELARKASQLGVERFVLDDGWFKGRHSERSSLGDWTVDLEKYPQGLTPLIDWVHELGMTFGLWIEPEMVSPDSDLYRAHPEWTLQLQHYPTLLSRKQLVLDLQQKEVFEYVLSAMDNLLKEYTIDYLKWDMNRDLTQPGHQGRAASHQHVLCMYELLHQIKRRHPYVEIESCASGGARIDYGMLTYCQRFWTSDNHDALERQRMYPMVSCFFPPEFLGAHVGPAVDSMTQRAQPLKFRALTAMFYHFGLEFDLVELSEAQQIELTQIVNFYKQWRHVFHQGQNFFLPTPDADACAYAVVHAEAIFVLVTQLTTSTNNTGFNLMLPMLSETSRYCIDLVHHNLSETHPSMQRLPMWLEKSIQLPGEYLKQIGLPIPKMPPQTALVLHVQSM